MLIKIMKIKKPIFIGLFLLLTGCLHTTEQSFVDANHDNLQTINSNLNYQEAYQILSERYKTCGRGSFNLNELIVNSALDTNAQLATISLSIQAPMMPPNYTIVIQLRPSDTGSVISIYKKNSFFSNDNVPIINNWLKGDQQCHDIG